MRFRFLKGGNPFRRQRGKQRFAWLPKRLDNGTIVWLEWYSRRRRSLAYHRPIARRA